jgi:hypothetical protein
MHWATSARLFLARLWGRLNVVADDATGTESDWLRTGDPQTQTQAQPQKPPDKKPDIAA